MHVLVVLTISIDEFQGSKADAIRTSCTEAFTEVAELDPSLISLLSVVEVIPSTVRRGLLWRRVLDSVTVVFEVKGLAVSTLGSTMANPEEGGYAQILTSKLLALYPSKVYTISVVVSQASEVSSQLAKFSAGASAVGSAMDICMAMATTGIASVSNAQAAIVSWAATGLFITN